MSRSYEQLECGCLVSCDGGGGLIPGHEDGKKECKADEYFNEHKMFGGACMKCDPEGYKRELQYTRERCLECGSTEMLNYYTKPDGDYIKEYWRCNQCLEIIELTVNLEGEVVDYKSYKIYEGLS
jgi:hypothetical protein